VIKLVTFQKRGSHLTRSEFAERWLTVHGPIAARFPGLRGYMLGFSIEDGEPQADGIAQLWFDNRAAAQASYASEIGRNGSADASAHLARREHLLASETWRKCEKALSDIPYKAVVAAKRAKGMARGDFVTWWTRDALADLGERLGAINIRASVDDAGQMLNSGTTGTLDLIAGEAVVDGLLEFWFASEAALRSALPVLRDEANVIAPQVSALETAALREHVVVEPPPPAFGSTSGMRP